MIGKAATVFVMLNGEVVEQIDYDPHLKAWVNRVTGDIATKTYLIKQAKKKYPHCEIKEVR